MNESNKNEFNLILKNAKEKTTILLILLIPFYVYLWSEYTNRGTYLSLSTVGVMTALVVASIATIEVIEGYEKYLNSYQSPISILKNNKSLEFIYGCFGVVLGTYLAPPLWSLMTENNASVLVFAQRVILSLILIILVTPLDISYFTKKGTHYFSFFDSQAKKSKIKKNLVKEVNDIVDKPINSCIESLITTNIPGANKVINNLRRSSSLASENPNNMLKMETTLYTCIPGILELLENYNKLKLLPNTENTSKSEDEIISTLREFGKLIDKENEEIYLSQINRSTEVLKEMTDKKLREEK